MGEETPQARLSAQWREQAEDIDRLSVIAPTAQLVANCLRRCADELDALQRHLCEEKTDEDSSTRMVNADPLTLKTPRPPDR